MKSFFGDTNKRRAVVVGATAIGTTLFYTFMKKRRSELELSDGNQRYKVSGFKQLTTLLDNLDNNYQVYILFYAEWCPDCRAGMPLVEQVINERILKNNDKCVFIKCFVGNKPFWKDQSNAFRTDKRFQVNSIPTLLQYDCKANSFVGGITNRLGDNECQEKSQIEAFFK